MPLADRTAVLVFDLDGTILRVNSFPAWVLFLIAGRMPGLGIRRRLALSLTSQAWLLRRKLRAASHDDLLHALQQCWQRTAGSQGAALAERFATAMLAQMRPSMATVLAWVRAERKDAILATAAAADYAEGLSTRLGFRHVLATPKDRSIGAPGNVGVHKRDQVLALLAAKGWRERPMILFTDHVDDLPLIRESSVVYWFGAGAALPTVANVRFIPSLELDGEALCAMLRSECTVADEVGFHPSVRFAAQSRPEGQRSLGSRQGQSGEEIADDLWHCTRSPAERGRADRYHERPIHPLPNPPPLRGRGSSVVRLRDLFVHPFALAPPAMDRGRCDLRVLGSVGRT
jgi:phosphoserine phosphatase